MTDTTDQTATRAATEARTAPDAPDPSAALPPGGKSTTPTRSPERQASPTARPSHAGNGGRPSVARPSTPEEMRAEIERTRARMSGTLDALEARLLQEKRSIERTKDDLWDKVTLQGPRKAVSREPWRSVAIAFAAGYILAAILD